MTAILFGNFVNDADIGMVEGRGRSGLALEALVGVGSVRGVLRKKFQGDPAT
jgi:hypothetical protein